MKIWDGSFGNSKFTETGNLVNDVIENGGRLLHEPTSDGYTHELVDRGEYLSEDYYYPDRTKPGKHIHYELRSNGEVLINGHLIGKKGGNTTMARKRVLTKGHKFERYPVEPADLGTVKDNLTRALQEDSKLQELGEKFLKDKETIEAQIQETMEARIPDNEKKKLLEELKNALKTLQEQFEEDVRQRQVEIQEEMEEELEQHAEVTEERRQEAEKLKDISLETGATDTSAAANEAEAKYQEALRIKNEYLQRLQMRKEQADRMEREMRARRLRGD